MGETTSDDLKATYGELTSADVTRLDAAAAELGMDSERLMEHAGWQVARSAVGSGLSRGTPVVVVAGRGNNGGDGVVAARLLATWGFPAQLFVYGTEDRLDEAFRRRLELAARCGVEATVGIDSELIRRCLEGACLAIDSLLGSGLIGDARAELHPLIDSLSNARTLSVDVPSGLDATTGGGVKIVHAAITCTLTAMKRGLWTVSGRAAAGRIFVADIGMPRAAWHACGLPVPTAVTEGALAEFPERS